MSGDIFLQRGEDDLVPMTEAPYDSGDVLQELLEVEPDIREAVIEAILRSGGLEKAS